VSWLRRFGAAGICLDSSFCVAGVFTAGPESTVKTAGGCSATGTAS
jgi:hypothetical protein